MPAALPVEKRRDIPVLTRLTRTEMERLRHTAAVERTTVAGLIRDSLATTGHLPPAAR